jgi:hypothetical protein
LGAGPRRTERGGRSKKSQMEKDIVSVHEVMRNVRGAALT